MVKGTVSVVIPTLNAAKYLGRLLESLLSQTRPPEEILVVDSASEDGTPGLCAGVERVRCIGIRREDFDHGGTRHMALEASGGDYVLFLTQDALPRDEKYIEYLLQPFSDDRVAMASGRQIARPGAPLAEGLTRAYNYPAQSHVRSREDIGRMGIKAFFASDVCSAYRRQAYEAVGGFERPALISEDMLIAARFLLNGWKVAYQADAAVYHSHAYTFREQFVRNFDTAACMAMHPEIFSGIPTDAEGIRMVRYVLKGLLRKGRLPEAVRYCFECGAKLYGNRLGAKYKDLSREKILRCTMNRRYWEREWQGEEAAENAGKNG